MIRTAFTLPDREGWTGGYQYFLNLFRVLNNFGHQKICPVVFVPEHVAEGDLKPLTRCNVEIVRDPVFSSKRSGARLVDAVISGRDHAALNVYRVHRIEVVFESAVWHGWRFPLRTIAWLPDFQHRKIPSMFGRFAWMRRELGFRAQISAADAIMLSSESAREDCEALYPTANGKISVVPFSVEPGDEAYAVSEAEVCARYNLSTPYFYLPNQYWRHKNHVLIIDALQIMCRKNMPVTVVASGSQVDPRHPGLFADLVERVERAGLPCHFRFLKLVPRPDVYALMRGSVAVLNPSLLEGWSTTVEEAKAMGVVLALSDIAVHREQAGADAYYFDPHSPEDTANLLGRVIEEAQNRGSAKSRTELQIRNAPRLRNYALDTENLIERVSVENRTITNAT